MNGPDTNSHGAGLTQCADPPEPASFLHRPPTRAAGTCYHSGASQRGLFPFNKCLAWNRCGRKHEESSGVAVPRREGRECSERNSFAPSSSSPFAPALNFRYNPSPDHILSPCQPGMTHNTHSSHRMLLFFLCDKNGPKHHPLHRNLASKQRCNQRPAQRTGCPVIKGPRHESKLFVYEIRC